MRKFNGFNKDGNLPYGMYNMTLEEVEETFSKNNSERRKEIIKEYKNHLKDIQNTGYCLDHWIDGSFVTTEKYPNDIDTLTEFDGAEVDKNGDREQIDNFINYSKSKTNERCHSLRVYRYPYYQKEDYLRFINNKRRILICLFGKDKNGNKKGVVHLIRRKNNDV